MKTLRVAIDTNPLYVAQAGVARYVRGLLRGLRESNPSDCCWLPLAWEVENFSYDQPTRALKTAFRELIWARWLAPRKLLSAGIELLHSTSEAMISPPVGLPHVVTLHDLALLRHPERFRRWQLLASTRRLRRLADVDHIICISRFTADEAMRLLGLPASQLTVVQNGYDTPAVEASEPPAAAIAFKEFFLFVGSLEPGKNLSLLREVWTAAAVAGQNLPPLLIAGTRWAGVPGKGPRRRTGITSGMCPTWSWTDCIGKLWHWFSPANTRASACLCSKLWAVAVR